MNNVEPLYNGQVVQVLFVPYMGSICILYCYVHQQIVHYIMEVSAIGSAY